MDATPYTKASLSWLRETDALETKALKRAYWERLVPRTTSEGRVLVRNESHADPAAHVHQVDVVNAIVTSCTCGAYTYNDTPCKHMVATSLAIDGGEITLDQSGSPAGPIEADI